MTNMAKPKIKTAIQKALKVNNITEQRLTGIISEAFDTESPKVISWESKHSYTTTALKLLGHLNSNNSIQIQTNIGLDIE